MVVCGTARRLTALSALALAWTLAAGCPKKQNVPVGVERPAEKTATGAFADTNSWLLRTSEPDANRGGRGLFLSNGLLGATFGAQGVAGKDSRCYVAGVYDSRENLQAVPTWNTLLLPSIQRGDSYEQTLDMKRGVLTTTWRDITVTSFVSAAEPNLAVIRVDGAEPTLPPPIQKDGIKVAYRKKAS